MQGRRAVVSPRRRLAIVSKFTDSNVEPPLSRRPMPQVTQVKGVAFRSNLSCAKEMLGEARFSAALRDCSAELRDAIQYREIVVGGWYPIAWYSELLRALAKASGQPPDEFVRALGRRSAQHDISGIYRALLRLLKPATILSLFGKLFGNYYNNGQLVVDGEGPKFVRLRLTGCIGFDRNMYLEILGSGEQLMEMAGGRNVRGRIVSGGQDGMTHAVLEGSWD